MSTLAGANNFTVDFNGDGLVSFAAPAAGQGRVTNSGALSGATITMDARSAEGAAVGVVNAGGTIVAQGARLQGGAIILDAGAGGNVDVSGSLNASGASGGGTIAVGISGNSLAGNVTLEKSAVLSADATQSGNGGSVKIDSLNKTDFDGLISTKGAGAAGAGGNVEVSTKGVLQFTGFADTSSLSGKAGTLLLDPTDLYINTSGTAPEAGASAISVATLESELAAGNVTLQTAFSGSQPGNITVAASFAWSADTALTIDAYRGIYIDNHVTVGANGAYDLLLETDDTGRGVGTVDFKGNGAIDANGTAVFIDYNPVNYDTPTNFSGDVTLTNGAFLSTNMLVNNLTDLQEIGKDATTLAGSYVLGRSINAAATSGWNSGAGFVPIGDAANPFTGDFSGNGHTISHLFIDNSGINNVGLFGVIGASGYIGDVTMTAESVTGDNYVGGLAGSNSGTVSQSSISGTVNGGGYTGGLVGTNSGTIEFSSMSGSVTGTEYAGGLVGASSGLVAYDSSKGSVGGSDYVGGLAGYSADTVNTSSSSDTVMGSEYLGGLIGENNGAAIEQSYATGKVTGTDNLGGLVGLAEGGGSITGSYAKGNVSGLDLLGGLVGNDMDTTIATSHAGGTVTSNQISGSDTDAGGLVGEYVLVNSASGAITSSYATGAVTAGGLYDGGLVGYNEANITSSYATGEVQPFNSGGSSFAGGLAGFNEGIISSSHAYGTVIGTTSVGGLVGGDSGSALELNSGEITNSYAQENVQAFGNNANSLGGLVGSNNGATILNSHAAGGIVSVSASITGTSAIGGLIGENSGNVTGSYSQDPVTVTSDTQFVGGLIGDNSGATINKSYSESQITGGLIDVGGLVGVNQDGGEIENSYATGSVTANLGTAVGTESFAVGGLVGENQGDLIIRSYASGAVQGNDEVGGLVGVNDGGGQIEKAEAGGAVTATPDPAVAGDGIDAGGLVGLAEGSISYVYATGNVSGFDDVGGLIGSIGSGATVNQAYSYGSASASNSTPVALGASIGLNGGATLTTIYWDSSNNQSATGVGSGVNSTTPLTTAQLTSGLPSGFSATIWGYNGGLPYLLGMP